MTRTFAVQTAACLTLAAALAGLGARAQEPGLKTRNVVLIVLDGVRPEEIFTGADEGLLDSEHGGIWADAKTLRREFWRDDATARRAALMPFLWGSIARDGQIFGNQKKGSVARVTNGQAFSYPGYNEMLTGRPDPQITSNEFGPNPNTTVFEWLNHLPELHDRIAVFGTWGTFADIFNVRRSRLHMQAGWRLEEIRGTGPRRQLIEELFRTTTRLDDEDLYDSFLQVLLRDYVETAKPRLLFVGYGEADNWAHSGRYDLVLDSCRQIDRFIEQLWKLMQSIPEYRGTTTFLITADHGRGHGPVEWKEHGAEEKGSENIWLAAMGPDTPALGERGPAEPLAQAQIAATIAALFGKDFRAENQAAAPPINDVIGRGNHTSNGR